MHHLVRIFLTGMLVSFLGSLPLGTLNIAAMQISITDGVLAAIMFSCGSLLVEIIYVRLSLVAMDWVRKQERLFRILEWVTLLIVLALAISSFYAALHPSVEKNVILSSTLPRFVLGVVMSAVNPVQIPFWFGWSTVLFTKKVLLPRKDHYNAYITGIGLGTLVGNCVFIFGGLFIASRINNNQHILNWVIGSIFAITALIQLWKIFRKKSSSHKIEHPEEMTGRIEEQAERIDEGLSKLAHKDRN
jgi:threonine/homoserine/homoserine lactone efflux protein